MKISLAQAIQLISQLNDEIAILKKQRREVASIRFLKGDVYTKTFEPDNLTKSIADLNCKIKELKVEIGYKNVTTEEVEYDGRVISLAEALILVQQIRNELSEIEDLSRLRDQPTLQSSFSGESSYVVANLDPQEYRRQARSMRRIANRLSTEIDKVNHNTFIEIEWANQYID